VTHSDGDTSRGDLDDFVERARNFLDARSLRRNDTDARRWGSGSDETSLFRIDTLARDSAELRAAREWVATRFDAGFGWISGPAEFGGLDLDLKYQLAYNELEAQYEVPDDTDLRLVGLALVVPTIYEHGTLEQRVEFLRPLLRGELLACQLFSEPGAGSDLASLRTRAVRDGDDWVVNGQKVWTSVAHCSDIGELLCRTDTTAAKHQGITAFLVDMDTPGLEVRSIRQMNGGSEFNEVFFHDVRIPDSRRLGAVNDGWKVGLTTLLNERSSVGTDDYVAAESWLNLGWLVAMLDSLQIRQDPQVRRDLAELYVKRKASACLRDQLTRAAREGRTPGPEASALKLLNTRNVTEAMHTVSEWLGPRLVADGGEWGTFSWSDLMLCTPALRLLGGTDEIMKNIIGERVLGLPKEPFVQERRS
jgi:acyl-CoA dehydrogenase